MFHLYSVDNIPHSYMQTKSHNLSDSTIGLVGSPLMADGKFLGRRLPVQS